MRSCQFRDLGRLGWKEAYALQRELVSLRKEGAIPDQFLVVEHPPVVTIGRNGKPESVLASEEVLARSGIGFHQTDRGGDATYHGPGQIVGYPIMDLREWKRDVVAYVRGVEEALIGALSEFGLKTGREEGMTGVWIGGGKIAAIGVHISRWVTSHGFALNVNPDLSHFQYIVPCGLSRPVTSMHREGIRVTRAEVVGALIRNFERVFGVNMEQRPDSSRPPAVGREIGTQTTADLITEKAR